MVSTTISRALKAWPALTTAMTPGIHAPLPYRQIGRHLPTVTDLSPMRGSAVLCMVDYDNIAISMQQLGYRVDFGRLRHRIAGNARTVWPWAALVTDPWDLAKAETLRRGGWRLLQIPRESVMTHRGPCEKANVDFDVCVAMGALVHRLPCDTILMGSGDGDMCVAIGRELRRLAARRALRIYTLSVVGATSHRLRARPELFDGNLLLGADLAETLY